MAQAAPQLTRYNGKGEAERLAEAERILSDKINGMPVSQMMEKYGCSKQTIYNRIDAAVKARIQPTVDTYREQMNAAYEEQMEMALQHKAAARILIDQATVSEDSRALAQGMTEHARAFDMIARTREAQRKLNGLDMPVRADVHVTVSSPVDNEIEALVAQLGDRRASRAG